MGRSLRGSDSRSPPSRPCSSVPVAPCVSSWRQPTSRPPWRQADPGRSAASCPGRRVWRSSSAGSLLSAAAGSAQRRQALPLRRSSVPGPLSEPESFRQARRRHGGSRRSRLPVRCFRQTSSRTRGTRRVGHAPQRRSQSPIRKLRSLCREPRLQACCRRAAPPHRRPARRLGSRPQPRKKLHPVLRRRHRRSSSPRRSSSRRASHPLRRCPSRQRSSRRSCLRHQSSTRRSSSPRPCLRNQSSTRRSSSPRPCLRNQSSTRRSPSRPPCLRCRRYRRSRDLSSPRLQVLGLRMPL
jgi:hypothetical protein